MSRLSNLNPLEAHPPNEIVICPVVSSAGHDMATVIIPDSWVLLKQKKLTGNFTGLTSLVLLLRTKADLYRSHLRTHRLRDLKNRNSIELLLLLCWDRRDRD
jgi:hypothetical protein